MIERVLSQAKVWGFVCECDFQGNWQILPQQKASRWKLQQVGDKWLLVIGDVPQVSCWSEEAIAFLERRRSDGENREIGNP